MTLVLTVNSPETIWMLADRRITFEDGAPKDDARKLMVLETTDGCAILGYAGLGMTASKTEPSDWMSAVLRGRNLPLEQSLRVLHDALQRQFPRHLDALPTKFGTSHSIVVSAFVDDTPAVFALEIGAAAPLREYRSRRMRYAKISPPGKLRPPRIVVAGSGLQSIERNRKALGTLLKLVRACDRKRIKAIQIADYLAETNARVSSLDESVSPKSIVLWRHRKSGVHGGGGETQFYDGTARESANAAIPTIANGMNIAGLCDAIASSVFPSLLNQLHGHQSPLCGETAVDAMVQSSVATVPSNPDERLR